MPKVSIIVPVYNVEKYLPQCMDSILNQTLKDIEIILVDDESPDKCPQMCDEYARQDVRIKVIHKKNAGLGMACNSGLEIATGEYVAFCDSDDWIDKDMYETMYNTAKEKDCDMVFTGLKRVEEQGKTHRNLPHIATETVFDNRKTINDFIKDMIASEPSCPSARKMMVSAKVVLYRRRIIEDSHLRFVSERQYPSEDLLFNVLVASHSSKICSLPLYFYNYMMNSTSITTTIRTDKFSPFKQLYYYTLNLCNHLAIEGADLRVQKMFIDYIRSYMCQILASGVESKRSIITAICKDKIWDEIFSNYPVNVMPIPHRIFIYALKYNMYCIMMLLAKLRK